MVNFFKSVVVVASLLCIGYVAAEQLGTKDEAKALAIKAAAFFEEAGVDEAKKQFSDKNGQWIDRDLYVFVYDNDGVVLAHGTKPHLVGKNLYKFRDIDGKFLIQEMLALQPNTEGWVDYKWQNSVSNIVDLKTSFIVRKADYFVGVGAHVSESTIANSDD